MGDGCAHQDANDLIREVLGANSEHRRALLFYGEVMLEQRYAHLERESDQLSLLHLTRLHFGAHYTTLWRLRNVEEALPIYLRLVAASMGEDPAIKRPLAILFGLPGAVESLKQKLPPKTAGKGAGDIYGYLANQAKERSQISVAGACFSPITSRRIIRPTLGVGRACAHLQRFHWCHRH